MLGLPEVLPSVPIVKEELPPPYKTQQQQQQQMQQPSGQGSRGGGRARQQQQQQQHGWGGRGDAGSNGSGGSRRKEQQQPPQGLPPVHRASAGYASPEQMQAGHPPQQQQQQQRRGRSRVSRSGSGSDPGVIAAAAAAIASDFGQQQQQHQRLQGELSPGIAATAFAAPMSSHPQQQQLEQQLQGAPPPLAQLTTQLGTEGPELTPSDVMGLMASSDAEPDMDELALLQEFLGLSPKAGAGGSQVDVSVLSPAAGPPVRAVVGGPRVPGLPGLLPVPGLGGVEGLSTELVQEQQSSAVMTAAPVGSTAAAVPAVEQLSVGLSLGGAAAAASTSGGGADMTMEGDINVGGIMLEGLVAGVRGTVSDELMMTEPPAAGVVAAAAAASGDLQPSPLDHQYLSAVALAHGGSPEVISATDPLLSSFVGVNAAGSSAVAVAPGLVQPGQASGEQLLVGQGSLTASVPLAAAAAAAACVDTAAAGVGGAMGGCSLPAVAAGVTAGGGSPVGVSRGGGVEPPSPVVGDVCFTMGVAPVASTRFATHRRSASTGMVPNVLGSGSGVVSDGIGAIAAAGDGGAIRSHSGALGGGSPGTRVTPGPEAGNAGGTPPSGSLSNSPAGSLQGSPTRPNDSGTAGIGVFKAAGVYVSPGVVTQGSGGLGRMREGSPNKVLAGAAEGRGVSPAAAAAVGDDVLDTEMAVEGAGGAAGGGGGSWGVQSAAGYSGFNSGGWHGHNA